MPVIVVANPKGGVGKSTLSTQVAGYFASRGHAVMLGDVDRQQSARAWLALRPAGVPPIVPWELAPDGVVRPPKGTTHVVLDTPAGLNGKRLEAVLRLADKVLIPLQPSLFDIQATYEFVRELIPAAVGADTSHRPQLGIVGMRMREGTISADQLRGFLDTLKVPVLTHLRDTQNYVHLAAHGRTLWDVAPSRYERDLAQWQPLLAWLDA
jgi:chromosome partitioning protein